MTEETGTPVAVDENRSAEPAPKAAVFDFGIHLKAEGLREEGIFVDLGPNFGHLEVCLRPGHSQAVLVKREAAEQAARQRLGLTDDDDVPTEVAIEVNKAVTVMCVVGARGNISANERLEAIAREHNFRVDGGTIKLSGGENGASVRELFAYMVENSHSMFITLSRAGNSLRKVDDREIAKLGKDFVFGKHGSLGWED